MQYREVCLLGLPALLNFAELIFYHKFYYNAKYVHVMINIIQRLCIICILFIAVACNIKRGNSVSKDSPMKDALVLTGCQEKIEMEVGSTVEIKLEAITGTGYQWLLKTPSPLLEQLEPDILRYSTPENKEVMPGRESFQVLRFKALEKGKGQIELQYKRTFEEGIEKSCVIDIEIK